MAEFWFKLARMAEEKGKMPRPIIKTKLQECRDRFVARLRLGPKIARACRSKNYWRRFMSAASRSNGPHRKSFLKSMLMKFNLMVGGLRTYMTLTARRSRES